MKSMHGGFSTNLQQTLSKKMTQTNGIQLSAPPKLSNHNVITGLFIMYPLL